MVHGNIAVVPDVAETLTTGTSKLGACISASAGMTNKYESQMWLKLPADMTYKYESQM